LLAVTFSDTADTFDAGTPPTPATWTSTIVSAAIVTGVGVELL
jgi:hypothetical protein